MHEPVPGFAIDARDEGDRHVVIPRGELDLATAPELERHVLERLGHGASVRLDLRELAFMDSSGVRALVTVHRAAASGDGALEIVRPGQGAAVDRVIVISGIAEQLGMVSE
jgi:anti-sigma B factor antagonist